MRGRHATTLSICLAVALAGCGSSKPAAKPKPSPLATVCTRPAETVIAQFVGVAPGIISARASMSSQAYPQCIYRAGRARVTAVVDTGPQPYFRLERTAVEAGQQFGTVRLEPAPVNISGLGLDADWFPGEHQVMTTDGRRLITVATSWSRAKAARRRALAVAVARTYLSRPLGARARGYPGGG